MLRLSLQTSVSKPLWNLQVVWRKLEKGTRVGREVCGVKSGITKLNGAALEMFY